VELRNYQRESVLAVYASWKANKNTPCLVLPTGAGKSVVIAKICEDVLRWDGRIIVVSHVKELLEQLETTLIKIGIDSDNIGVYSAGLKRRETDRQITIGGIQSIHKRSADFLQHGKINVVVVDESHRINPGLEDSMYSNFLKDMRGSNADLKIAGLTATPYRLDDGLIYGKDKLFESVCYESETEDLQEQGYLSPLVGKKSKQEIDLKKLPKARGDFKSTEMGLRFLDKVEKCVQEIILQTDDRKKVLIFCCNVDHAEKTKAVFERYGKTCGLVSSMHANRDEEIAAFKAGKLKFLVNINVLTTGFDDPDMDCIALLRSTMSTSLYVQILGRGLRIHPDKKDCMILDFGDNIKRHGVLSDLNIKKDKEKRKTIAAKACPKCETMCSIAVKICPNCRYHFKAEEVDPNHKDKASDLSPTQKIQKWKSEVRTRTLRRHVSAARNVSMKVTYALFDGMYIDEYVPFESPNEWARTNAERWWRYRTGNYDCPKKVDDAIKRITYGEFTKEVAEITYVKQKNGFPKIVRRKFRNVNDG